MIFGGRLMDIGVKKIRVISEIRGSNISPKLVTLNQSNDL